MIQIATRIGTLLERYVFEIFELAGFNIKHQSRIKGYEIDVLAEKKGNTIICECKQYENSNLTVRNIIHQWDSKNKEIGADIVVLAFYGVPVSKDDRKLAKKHGIHIWEEKDLEKYRKLLTKNRKKGTNKIMADLGIEVNILNLISSSIKNLFRVFWTSCKLTKKVIFNKVFWSLLIVLLIAIMLLRVSQNQPQEDSIDKKLSEIEPILDEVQEIDTTGEEITQEEEPAEQIQIEQKEEPKSDRLWDDPFLKEVNDKVHEGGDIDEVISLLGEPTEKEYHETTGGIWYIYVEEEAKAMILIVDKKVLSVSLIKNGAQWIR